MRRGREIWRGVGRIGIGTVGFLLAFFLVHLPHGPEHWSADLCTALLSDQLKGQHPRIAIVEVDEQTLRESNYLSPVDRSTLAAIVRGLHRGRRQRRLGLTSCSTDTPKMPEAKELLDVIKGSSVPIVLGALDEPSAENQAFESAFLAVASRPIGHLYYGEHHNPAVITDQVIREMADPREYPGRQSFAELVARAAGTYRPPASLVISWLRPPKDGRETFLTLSGQDVRGRGLKESVAAEGDARWQDRSGRRQFYSIATNISRRSPCCAAIGIPESISACADSGATLRREPPADLDAAGLAGLAFFGRACGCWWVYGWTIATAESTTTWG